MKLMVDAAVARNKDRGSYAALYQDEYGLFLGASAVVLQVQVEPEILEAMAFNEGLALAFDLYLRRIHVATNCAAIISHLKGPYLRTNSNVIQDIRKKFEDFEYVSFEHEKRAMNREDHDLARASNSIDFGHHVWPINPPDLLCTERSVVIE